MTAIKISELIEQTVIEPSDYFPFLDVSDTAQGNDGSTRKILFQNISYVNRIVKATGSNDEILINAAIDAVSSLGGGIVFCPDPLYSLSSFVLMKSNVELLGIRGYTTFKKIAAGNFNGIGATSINNFAIRGIKVDGNHTNGATGRGISLNTCTDGIVERNNVIDCVEGIFNTACTDIIFEKNISDSNYEWNFYTFAGTRIKMLYNRSLNAKHLNLEGFGMAFYNNNYYCEAIGNYIYNSVHNGLQVNAGSATQDVVGVLLRGNFVENAGNRGIFVTDDGNASFHVKRITIINNRVKSSVDNGIYCINTYDSTLIGNNSISNAQSGMLLETCHNIGVIGNNSVSNTKYGINLQGTIDSILNSNNCNNNGFKGMMLQQQSTTQSTGNIVTNNRATANGQGGIWTLNTASGNLFIGNNVAGNTSNNMSIVADATTIIRENIGFVTENSGIGTINSGSTAVVITHGLGATPTLKNISVILGENPTSDPGNIWVDTITSTQFTINCRNNPGVSNLDLAWRAVIL